MIKILKYGDVKLIDDFFITDADLNFLISYGGEPGCSACGSAMSWLEKEIIQARSEGYEIYGWKVNTDSSQEF